MQPLFSYKDLVRMQSNPYHPKMGENWYLFLLVNPRNQTRACVDIMRNLSYLDMRTTVTFFLPGFMNDGKGGIVDSNSVYDDKSLGELYFDENGFLETINWLEAGNPSYKYSEGIDLVIIKGTSFILSTRFDFKNMLFYDLDRLKRDEVNIIGLLTECMRIVSRYSSEREVKQRMNEYISQYIKIDEKKQRNKILDVFIAGSIDMQIERNTVIAELTRISRRRGRDNLSFQITTFEDFDRFLTKEGRQEEYNSYIRNRTDYAIFILAERAGLITLDEFKVAFEAFQENGKPRIFVYSQVTSEGEHLPEDHGIQVIRNYMNQMGRYGQYYVEYSDLRDLQNQIFHDFIDIE